MTRPEQKRIERAIIETFLQAARIEAAIDDNREAPDAELAFPDDTRVGVEITELTDPSLKESSAAMKRLGAEARRLLKGVQVFVHVHWHEEALLDPARTKETAAQLAMLVREILQCRPKKFGRRRMLRRKSALAQMDDVLVLPSEDGPKISPSSERWNARGLPEIVQARLAEKEQKLAKYRASSPLPQWLVIATGTERAQHVLPQMLPRDHVYASSFDRAFLLDVPIRLVDELRLVRPSGSSPR